MRRPMAVESSSDSGVVASWCVSFVDGEIKREGENGGRSWVESVREKVRSGRERGGKKKKLTGRRVSWRRSGGGLETKKSIEMKKGTKPRVSSVWPVVNRSKTTCGGMGMQCNGSWRGAGGKGAWTFFSLVVNSINSPRQKRGGGTKTTCARLYGEQG